MAKYELMHSVRSHIGADDDAFNAIRQREDEDGIRGILLQRNVVPTAATALKTNIASLAPLVLPFTELVRPPRPAAPSAASLCTMTCLHSSSASAILLHHKLIRRGGEWCGVLDSWQQCAALLWRCYSGVLLKLERH